MKRLYMASVKLINIAKYFNNNRILNNISVDITDGEFIVILGPSGCGKSTLLRIIAGLENLSEGSVVIGDENVSTLEPKDRKIAMVFQNYALYPHMTVYNNIAYGLKLHKVQKSTIEKKVQQAAELLQLKDLLNRKPNQLSGGQRQRVAMGRAIVREPNVFLFDEPLSNLDAKLRTQMRFEIKNIHSNVKTTSIYVTHDQIEAMTLADRIILLNKGKIEQIGTPLDLYNSPSSIFVAGFIGNPPMNFISSEFAKIFLKNSDLPIDNCIVGIRPENLKIVKEDEPMSKKVAIKMTECIGHETLIYALDEKSNQNIIIKTSNYQIKNEKYINIKPVNENNLHFFSHETEQRITF
ncbi:sn-glycerol-3-phosphate ABC transporter ATP-binding protein UgpC [Pigmentibacter sp. JX0631]|uniref:ABC transporter ATP-binding protein n=1 Tax=Pigmentibacter sp. JX0631 TaxID=2976982 RepID=UPI002468D04C|nr:sn-glycerol-3-phosphate ABC transporter ATP-binding protein UgpC [Pigmentibacter sp. JX0631]WGL61348.1 sn-glycerol-3-phosphate ABC transporter ATP-binding protein UgpC [Pigmentibacter sp. JX0631]